MKPDIRFKIADLVISVSHDSSGINLWHKEDYSQDTYKPFLVSSRKDIDVTVNLFKKDNLDLKAAEKIFDSGGLWCIYRKNKNYIFAFKSALSDNMPYEIAIPRNNYRVIDIYFSEDLLKKAKSAPLGYPVIQILIAAVLSKGLGVIVHSSCVNYKEKGLLFAGHSGAGKSTLARIWKNTENNRNTALTDDRTIIRKIGKEFKVYGTPWSGTSNVYSADSAKLDRIFFLSHSDRNIIERIDYNNAALSLIPHCFLSYWDKDWLRFGLSFSSFLCKKINCYKLGFVPDESAVDLIKEFSN